GRRMKKEDQNITKSPPCNWPPAPRHERASSPFGTRFRLPPATRPPRAASCARRPPAPRGVRLRPAARDTIRQVPGDGLQANLRVPLAICRAHRGGPAPGPAPLPPGRHRGDHLTFLARISGADVVRRCLVAALRR